MTAPGHTPLSEATVRRRLAENIRTLRRVRELGQAELAQAAGVSRRTLARLEAGDVQDPGVAQIGAIAAALGVTGEWLVGEPLVVVELAVPASIAAALEGKEAIATLEALRALRRW